jgi:hypothetical protein
MESGRQRGGGALLRTLLHSHLKTNLGLFGDNPLVGLFGGGDTHDAGVLGNTLVAGDNPMAAGVNDGTSSSLRRDDIVAGVLGNALVAGNGLLAGLCFGDGLC